MVRYKKIMNPFTGRHQKVLDETSIEPIDQDILNNLYDNDLINAFRISILGSFPKYNMSDGIMDEFEDESGVDVGASIDEVYDSDEDYYTNYAIDTNTLLLFHADADPVVDSSPNNHVISEHGAIKVSGIATSSTNFGAEYADMAFDGNNGTWWSSEQVGLPQWLKYDLGSGNDTVLTNFTIRMRGTDQPAYPKDFKIQGSNNDSAWTDLSTITGETWSSYIEKIFSFSNTTSYRYYRFYITAVQSQNYVQIGEITGFPTVYNAINFGAGTTSITSASSSKFAVGTGDFTFETKITPLSIANQTILDTRSSDPATGIYIGFSSSLTIGYYDVTASHASINSMIRNKEQHICVMRKSGIIYFFINGVEAGGSFVSATNITETNFRLGAYWNGSIRNFRGYMDEVRFSDVARYAITGFVPPTSPHIVTQSPQNMSLISNETEADANPDSVRAVIMVEEIDTQTINTDLKAYASRDDGANWVEITLSLEANIEDSLKVYAGTADVSGQASDKTIKWKIQTFNNKGVKIHGVGNIWD